MAMDIDTVTAKSHVEEAISLITKLADFSTNPLIKKVHHCLILARSEMLLPSSTCATPSSTNRSKRGRTDVSDSPMAQDGNQRTEIQELMEFIEQCHFKTREAISNGKTYAEAVTAGTSQTWPPRAPEQRIAIRVEKSDRGVKLKGRTLADTLSTIECINTIGVDTVQKPDHLILRVRKAEESTLIMKELADAGCNVNVLKKRLPQLKILHVPTTTTDQELEEDLKRKNPEFDVAGVRAVGARKNRKDDTTKTVILQVTTDIASRYLKSSGRVYLKYQTHPVILDDQLVQCWGCRMFGHTTKNCNTASAKDDVNTLCPKCGEKHPKNNHCEVYNCINCRKENDKGRGRPGRKPLDTKHACNNYKACGVAKKYRANLMSTIYGS